MTSAKFLYFWPPPPCLNLIPPPLTLSALEKVVGLTGFAIIQVFIASSSPAQGERNQMVNANFTRPVNVMPLSSLHVQEHPSHSATQRGAWTSLIEAPFGIGRAEAAKLLFHM